MAEDFVAPEVRMLVVFGVAIINTMCGCCNINVSYYIKINATISLSLNTIANQRVPEANRRVPSAVRETRQPRR